MSTEKGNAKKRPQKYQNSKAFRNDVHDTSKTTKSLNEMVASGARGVCRRCKEQIEWKIKYKKYKPLTQPKKCVRCEQKSVTEAYHIVCTPCASTANICAKCAKNEDVVTCPSLSPAEDASQASQLAAELKHLTERQRRAFLRYQAKGCQESGDKDREELGQASKSRELNIDEVENDLDSDGDSNESNELDQRCS